jgi:hypothetical protein
VLDEQGEPLAGATVNAQVYQFLDGRRVLMPGGSSVVPQPETFAPLARAVTDDRGDYRLFWLPPGEYYVSVTARPQITSPPTADVATPPAPTERPFLGGCSTALPEPLYSIYFPGVAGSEGASPVTLPRRPNFVALISTGGRSACHRFADAQSFQMVASRNQLERAVRAQAAQCF